MSEDENDRGDRDNTGREHRPKSSQHNENAPTGSQGTHHMTPSPGGGMSQKRHATQSREQGDDAQGRTPSQQDQGTDSQPAFKETGDKEVDAHYQETHRMIPKDDPAHGESTEGPKRSQSNFARAFHQAGEVGRSKDQDQSL